MMAGRSADVDWSDILAPGERLYWTGRPVYGARTWQLVGHEPVWYAAFGAGIAIMWISVPFIPADGSFGAWEAAWVYGAVTLCFVLYAYYMISTRAYVLGSLDYAVTDRRAIVCRHGRDPLLRRRRYFVSCPLHPEWSFPIVKLWPLEAVQVGSALSGEAVQPLGWGLIHPGWPVLLGRLTVPVLFENIPDAGAVRDILVTAARNAGP